MNIKQIGIDIGKMTFHMVALNGENEIVIRRQFTRSQLITFFTKRTGQDLNVAFEACSGAHWLAHQLIALGHKVRLLTPESVKPFAKAQKNDWNDALVVAEAATRPGQVLCWREIAGAARYASPPPGTATADDLENGVDQPGQRAPARKRLGFSLGSSAV